MIFHTHGDLCSFSGNSIDEIHSAVSQLVSDGVPNYHSSIISASYAACRYVEQSISIEGSSLSALVHGSQRRSEWKAAWQIFCPGQQFLKTSYCSYYQLKHRQHSLVSQPAVNCLTKARWPSSMHLRGAPLGNAWGRIRLGIRRKALSSEDELAWHRLGRQSVRRLSRLHS